MDTKNPTIGFHPDRLILQEEVADKFFKGAAVVFTEDLGEIDRLAAGQFKQLGTESPWCQLGERNGAPLVCHSTYAWLAKPDAGVGSMPAADKMLTHLDLPQLDHIISSVTHRFRMETVLRALLCTHAADKVREHARLALDVISGESQDGRKESRVLPTFGNLVTASGVKGCSLIDAALTHAASADNPASVKALLAAGAKPNEEAFWNAASDGHHQVLDLLRPHYNGQCAGGAKTYTFTLLHAAAGNTKGCPATLDAALRYANAGAINAGDPENGSTPLHWALEQCLRKNEDIGPVVTRLLELGANADIPMTANSEFRKENTKGTTPRTLIARINPAFAKKKLPAPNQMTGAKI